MFTSQIETARLVLRRPTLADAADIFRSYASNPHVTRYMSWPAHRSVADAERFLCELTEATTREEQYAWAIVERETQCLRGMIGLQLQPPTATMGYCLAEEVWGLGYASEAVGAVVRRVWASGAIERLEAYCHTQHHRSARVLEKAGFCYRGIARARSVLPALGGQKQVMLHYTISRPRQATSKSYNGQRERALPP